MVNFGAKILNNAVGSLSTQQAMIAATSNNIANVNTPNYARRQVEVQARVNSGSDGSFAVGSGVEVAQVRRVVDDFLDRLHVSTTSDSSGAKVVSDFMGRVDELFNLTGDVPTIGSTMTDFFSAINDLSADPSNIPLRTNVLNKADAVVSSIRATYGAIAALQQEANQRLTGEVQAVNALIGQIAELNAAISSREGIGGFAADERDRRDFVVLKLAEKIGIQTQEQKDGSLTVSLPGGFSLVSGTVSRPLEVTNAPSFSTGNLPPSLAGPALSHIVYDFDPGAGAAHIDLTPRLLGAGGTIGGILAVRGYNEPANTSAFEAGGPLIEIAARVEGLARNLLTTFNAEYLGPDRLSGTAGFQPSSGDLNGNVPTAAFALFNVTGSTSLDTNGNGIPESVDLDGSGIDNFASILNLAVTQPRLLAAARDQSGGAATPVFPPGDGSNMVALAALQSSAGTFAAGSYSFSGSYNDAYGELVGHVGNIGSRARLSASVADDTMVAARSRREEVSGVSLDEEFTSLIKFQKVYEASARLIRIADELLEQVVNLI